MELEATIVASSTGLGVGFPMLVRLIRQKLSYIPQLRFYV